VRFFWVLDENDGVARIGLWATSPVTEVVADAEGVTDTAGGPPPAVDIGLGSD
jgi:hypothetical protein